MVYVLSKTGKPLMPTKRHGKVRRLLKDGKAKVVSVKPFTIQLLYKTTEFTQPITVGIDTGKTIGFAVVNKTSGQILQKGEIQLRDNISKLLIQRRQYRRSRRYRKTWYRQPRFNNRTRPQGWFAPSIRSQLNHTLSWIDRLSKYLPNPQIIVEIAKFDMQKIQNPNINGKEYQQGNLYGYVNTRAYLIAREHGKCQLCGKEYNGNGWHIHHIVPRLKGGTNKPSNLALLHKECHNKLHKDFTKYSKKLKKPKLYKEPAYMNTYRLQLIKNLKKIYGDNVNFTYGYFTNLNRNALELPKAHYNDAIAMTKIKQVKDINEITYIKQVRKKKRSLYEAIPRRGRTKPNTEAKRSPKNTKLIIVNGKKWCLWDSVRVGGKIGFISGFTSNYVYVQDIDGNYLKLEGTNYKRIPTKALKLIKRNNNWIQTIKTA